MHTESSSIKERLAGLTVAVTGHRGFIGRHLIAELRSMEVTVRPVEGDVRSAESWTEDFDLLYHMAAVMPGRFVEDPKTGFSVNVGGTLQALESCRLRRARMVFPSTSGVYSPVVSGAVSEDHPLAPQTPYAQSKRMGEILCHTYASHYGVPCTVFRLFNIYGAGQKSEFLIPYLIRCCLERRTATIYNQNSYRDFLYIDDAVEALLHAVLNHTLYAVFNIGSGVPSRVGQIIDMIGLAAEAPLRWKQGEGRTDPQPKVFAQIKAASEKLGWFPTVSVEKGIQKTVLALSGGVQ